MHDAPLIQYYASHRGLGKVTIVGEIFEKDVYGIALSTDSSIRSEINIALLHLKEDWTCQEIYDKWFK